MERSTKADKPRLICQSRASDDIHFLKDTPRRIQRAIVLLYDLECISGSCDDVFDKYDSALSSFPELPEQYEVIETNFETG